MLGSNLLRALCAVVWLPLLAVFVRQSVRQDQRMHFRPELTGRRALGRRGLQVVSALYRATAISARADMHVDPRSRRPLPPL